MERPPERVLEDIKDDYATPAGAREQYGVVVKEIDRRRVHYEIDREATAELRAAMRAARG